MDDLIAFLNARLDEDERRAKGSPAEGRIWRRALREVEAKRAILELHKPREYDRYGRTGIYCRTCVTDHEAYMDDDTPDSWPCLTVRHLAAAYSDHPDEPLRVVPADEYDQVVRLAAFRVAHPGVLVRDLGRGGIWQALIPEDDGETVVTRIQLKDLLDKLAELLG